jgi:hypothetical protein
VPEEVAESGKAEWLAERVALIMDGCNCDAFKAERLAREAWESSFGDPQGKLF